jgi:hypothetical protein
VMDLADINRFIAVVDQQRRASPTHRYYICNHSSDAICYSGLWPIVTMPICSSDRTYISPEECSITLN